MEVLLDVLRLEGGVGRLAAAGGVELAEVHAEEAVDELGVGALDDAAARPLRLRPDGNAGYLHSVVEDLLQVPPLPRTPSSTAPTPPPVSTPSYLTPSSAAGRGLDGARGEGRGVR